MDKPLPGLKGVATVTLVDGTKFKATISSYEPAGVVINSIKWADDQYSKGKRWGVTFYPYEEIKCITQTFQKGEDLLYVPV